jgi:hypothetical protein
MTLQRQTFGPSRPVGPRKIPFILPGRRTLSEHLPTEIIDVPITVAQRSIFLRKVIVQQALNDPSERQIRLPGVDSMGFRMYIEWLRTGHVEFHMSGSSGGLLLRDSFDLIFAHIAGSQLEEPHFQDYIIDTLARLLDISQTPDLKVLEVVFLEKGTSNILKQFVIDRMFAIERRMLGMIRGFVENADTGLGCEYHVHGVGECYRHNFNDPFTNASSIADEPHDTFNASIRYAYNDNEHLRSSSATDHYTTKTTNATFYNMMETAYVGTEKWSREIHGLGRRTPVLNRHNDKPLPTIPPLRPGTSPTSPTSPTPPASPRFPQSVFPKYTDTQAISTKQLVSQCLARIPRSDTSLSSIPCVSTNADRSAIPMLVLECLERFKKNNAENMSSSSSEGSPAARKLLPNKPSLYGKPVSHSQRATNPSPQGELRWQPSFEKLFQPAMVRRPTERPVIPTIDTQHADYQYPSSLEARSPIPTHTSTVKRKAAPDRGEDWLKQYDSTNVMMSNAPVVMAKRSKKSRFKELLRSNSAMSTMELEGSVLKVRSGTEGAM